MARPFDSRMQLDETLNARIDGGTHWVHRRVFFAPLEAVWAQSAAISCLPARGTDATYYVPGATVAYVHSVRVERPKHKADQTPPNAPVLVSITILEPKTWTVDSLITTMKELPRRTFVNGWKGGNGVRRFEGATATIESVAKAALPIYQPFPSDATLALAATTVTGTASGTPPTTVLTPSADVFTAAMVGQVIDITSIGRFIIQSIDANTPKRVTVVGTATTGAGKTFSVYGMWSSVLLRYRIDEKSESSGDYSVVTAYYGTLPNGAIRRFQNYLQVVYHERLDRMTQDLSTPAKKIGKTYVGTAGDAGKLFRDLPITGTSVVRRAGKSYVLIVELDTVGTLSGYIDSMVGKINSDDCSTYFPGGTAGMLLMRKPVIRAMKVGITNSTNVQQRRVIARIQVDLCSVAGGWNSTLKTQKQQAFTYEQPVLNSAGVDTNDKRHVTFWQDTADAVVVCTGYETAAFANLLQYIIKE